MINCFCNKKKYKELLSVIKKTDSILLFTHINPDGDALGSLISLNMAMQKFKKPVYAVIIDKVNHDLDFMPGIEDLVLLSELIKNKNFNYNSALALSVDVADKKRMGDALNIYEKCKFKVQIDHHLTNDAFADINYIDPSAAASGIMVYEFIKENKISLSEAMAINLYAAISTDTGNFSYNNSDSRCFSILSEITKIKFPIDRISFILYKRKSVPQLSVLARALNNLNMICNNKAAYVFITKNDLIETSATSEHTNTIVNNVVEIEGVNIGFFAYESMDGSLRVSFRSKAPYKVDEIAKKHGGGGHVHASGCTINDTLENAINIIIKDIEMELQKHSND